VKGTEVISQFHKDPWNKEAKEISKEKFVAFKSIKIVQMLTRED